MKRIIVSLFITFLLLSFSSLTAQNSKQEKKFWKNKAKGYVKNPIALKSEFENYQNQIKDLKNRNKELVEQINAGPSPSGGSGLVDSLRWAIIQLEGELQSTKNQYAKLEQAYKTEKKTGDMGIKPGLIYGIQIGAFVFYEMQNPPIDANDVVVERADGFNKYVIGNFRLYDEAVSFRDELRKMGVTDAWIVPYIDGIRATMDEANQYLQNQGNY